MKRRSHVTARHTLLTDAWTAQVQALETAVGRFEADEPVTNDCQVAFFEIEPIRAPATSAARCEESP